MAKVSLNSITAKLMHPVDSSTLGTFRILFGAVMLWSIYGYLNLGGIKALYINRNFHFPFAWFPWVSRLPGDGMYYCYVAMGFGALFLALGLFYRVSAFVFFVTYTYVFLIDKSLYNNHYYFICLLGFLFCLINANSWLSLDRLRKPSLPENIPYWNLLIIKAQVFIVYFYGGIAKINGDWLRGEPMRHWLADRADYPVIGQFLSTELAAYLFSFGGLFFYIIK